MNHGERRLHILGGWIAGPAFGVAMMAAPDYLKLQPFFAAPIFWGGIIVFALTIFVVIALSTHEQEKKHKPMWPIVTMAIGVLIFGVGAAGYFWPSVPRSESTSSGAEDTRWSWAALTDSEIELLFEKLQGKGQLSIHVACNRPECSKLAYSFDRLFKRLAWPSVIGDGGILATGVSGILINPTDDGAQLLKRAIETTTVLRPLLGVPRPVGASDPIMLVIGTKPEVLPTGPVPVPQVAEQPDVTLRFVYPSSPALVLVNGSGAIARNIKWSVALWNMDDPRTYVSSNPSPDAHDPLPIPVATFDFLRPRTVGGPQNLFDGPLVAPHLKNGQRLFGSASVVCPECARGHTYIVSIIWGEGGWYVETLNSNEGELLIPPNFKQETVIAYYRDILAKTPEAVRIPIEDK
jgi:hypothetical protein